MAISKHTLVSAKFIVCLMLTVLVLAALSGGFMAAYSDNTFSFSNSGKLFPAAETLPTRL
ncbi:MAG: hypothetical protein EOM14_01470 [Clostridia bacterium]|nr:hypothetical protein [Clostridia bacterium]